MSKTVAIPFQPGQRLGLVTVIKRSPPSPHGSVQWLCKCDCGKVRWLRANNLNNHPPKTHRKCYTGADYDPVLHGTPECSPAN
jgi:hypothetical protein